MRLSAYGEALKTNTSGGMRGRLTPAFTRWTAGYFFGRKMRLTMRKQRPRSSALAMPRAKSWR